MNSVCDSVANQWPEAPDLQLDCLSSDSDSDSISVEVVVNANNNCLNKQKSNTTNGILEPKAGPSHSLTTTLSASKRDPSLTASATAILVDLTQSDDESTIESNTKALKSESSATTSAAIGAKRDHRLTRDHHHNDLNHSRSSCIQLAPPMNISQPLVNNTNNIFNSNPNYPQLVPEFQSCRYHNQNNVNNVNNINTNNSNISVNTSNPNININNSSVGAYPQMSSNSEGFPNLIDYSPFNCNFTNNLNGNQSHTPMVSTAQCPHNHGFYSATTSPINSPHLAYIPNIPSMPSIAPNIPPNGSNVSQYGHYFSPPPAHLPLHPYSMHPHSRLHPNQQRLWVAQQRMNEMQRQRQSLYQQQMFVRFVHFFTQLSL